MNFKGKVALCVFACFLSANLYGQQQSSSCLLQLKSALTREKQKLKGIFDKGRGWHMTMLTESEVLDEGKNSFQKHTENGEVIAGTHMRYSKGNKIEIFANDIDAFTVNPGSRVVTHTRSNPAYLKIKDDSYLKILQDTLFNFMEVTDCNFVNLNNKRVQCFNMKAKNPRSPLEKLSISWRSCQ